jgi:hypothetical protein
MGEIEPILPWLLAFVIASLVTLFEFVTSTYPRTAFLVCKSKYLYVYVAIYGAIAALLTALFPLLAAEQATIEGAGADNPWVQALVIGVSVKALLHIRLFNVNTGPEKAFPVGVETVVMLFEPWLIRNIDLDHFNELMTYVGEAQKRYSDLDQIKSTIGHNIPRSFSDPEKATLKRDIDNAPTARDAMEIYLTYVGRRTFERVFP